MKILKVNGTIVDDGDAIFYEHWGMPHTSPKMVHDFLDKLNGESIQVYINSGGGSVFAGSEIYTALKKYSGQVETIATGVAASIASVILMAGDYVRVSPISQIMIHNASMISRGDHRDLEHDSKTLEGTSLSLANVYAEKTGMEVKAIKEMMDSETWLTADKAVYYGFADSILFNDDIVEMVASMSPIVPKEKINEFKSLVMQQEQGKKKEKNTNYFEKIVEVRKNEQKSNFAKFVK